MNAVTHTGHMVWLTLRVWITHPWWLGTLRSLPLVLPLVLLLALVAAS